MDELIKAKILLSVDTLRVDNYNSNSMAVKLFAAFGVSAFIEVCLEGFDNDTKYLKTKELRKFLASPATFEKVYEGVALGYMTSLYLHPKADEHPDLLSKVQKLIELLKDSVHQVLQVDTKEDLDKYIALSTSFTLVYLEIYNMFYNKLRVDAYEAVLLLLKNEIADAIDLGPLFTTHLERIETCELVKYIYAEDLLNKPIDGSTTLEFIKKTCKDIPNIIVSSIFGPQYLVKYLVLNIMMELAGINEADNIKNLINKLSSNEFVIKSQEIRSIVAELERRVDLLKDNRKEEEEILD